MMADLRVCFLAPSSLFYLFKLPPILSSSLPTPPPFSSSPNPIPRPYPLSLYLPRFLPLALLPFHTVYPPPVLHFPFQSHPCLSLPFLTPPYPYPLPPHFALLRISSSSYPPCFRPPRTFFLLYSPLLSPLLSILHFFLLSPPFLESIEPSLTIVSLLPLLRTGPLSDLGVLTLPSYSENAGDFFPFTPPFILPYLFLYPFLPHFLSPHPSHYLRPPGRPTTVVNVSPVSPLPAVKTRYLPKS